VGTTATVGTEKATTTCVTRQTATVVVTVGPAALRASPAAGRTLKYSETSKTQSFRSRPRSRASAKHKPLPRGAGRRAVLCIAQRPPVEQREPLPVRPRVHRVQGSSWRARER
jgi:hypothetical protein